MAFPSGKGVAVADAVGSAIVGGSGQEVGFDIVVRSASPGPTDLMKVWEPWKRYIFDAMASMNVQDLSGTVPDAIGHWLVKVLKAEDPAMIAPGYVMTPENPGLNQIDNSRQQQGALVVNGVAGTAVAIREAEGYHATMPVAKRRRIDDTSISASLVLSVKKLLAVRMRRSRERWWIILIPLRRGRAEFQIC